MSTNTLLFPRLDPSSPSETSTPASPRIRKLSSLMDPTRKLWQRLRHKSSTSPTMSAAAPIPQPSPSFSVASSASSEIGTPEDGQSLRSPVKLRSYSSPDLPRERKKLAVSAPLDELFDLVKRKEETERATMTITRTPIDAVRKEEESGSDDEYGPAEPRRVITAQRTTSWAISDSDSDGEEEPTPPVAREQKGSDTPTYKSEATIRASPGRLTIPTGSLGVQQITQHTQTRLSATIAPELILMRTRILRRLRSSHLTHAHQLELHDFRSSLSAPSSPRSPSITQRLEPSKEATVFEDRRALPDPHLERLSKWAGRPAYDVRCVEYRAIYAESTKTRFTLTPRKTTMVDLVETPVHCRRRSTLTFSPRVRFLSQIFKKPDLPILRPRRESREVQPVVQRGSREAASESRPKREQRPLRQNDATEITYAVRPGPVGPLLPPFDPTPRPSLPTSYSQPILPLRREHDEEDDTPLASVRDAYARRQSASFAPTSRPMSMYSLASVATGAATMKPVMSDRQRERMRAQVEAEQRERARLQSEAEQRLEDHRRWDRQLRRRSAANALAAIGTPAAPAKHPLSRSQGSSPMSSPLAPPQQQRRSSWVPPAPAADARAPAMLGTRRSTTMPMLPPPAIAVPDPSHQRRQSDFYRLPHGSAPALHERRVSFVPSLPPTPSPPASPLHRPTLGRSSMPASYSSPTLVAPPPHPNESPRRHSYVAQEEQQQSRRAMMGARRGSAFFLDATTAATTRPSPLR